MRALAREAGVHIYSGQDDFLNANNSVCVLHAREGGEKRINLPSRCDVYDVLNGRQLVTEASSVKVTLQEGETGIYFFGSQREWEGE